MAESYFSTSPYAYTRNDPVNRIDVMGLWDDYDDDWYMVDQDGDGRPDEGSVPFYDPNMTGHQDGLVWEGEIDNFDDIYLDEVVVEENFDWDQAMENFKEGIEELSHQIEVVDEMNNENREKSREINEKTRQILNKQFKVLIKLEQSQNESEKLNTMMVSPSFYAMAISIIGIEVVLKILHIPEFGPDPANLMEEQIKKGQYYWQ